MRKNLTDKQQEALDAVAKYGSQRSAAEALGLALSTFQARLSLANRKIDPAIARGMDILGTELVPSTGWVKTKPGDDGVSYSFLLKPAPVDQIATIREAFTGIEAAPVIPPPLHANDDLLTLYPIADLHMGMLAWARETGEAYDTAIAALRVKSWIAQCIHSSPESAVGVILAAGDLLHADDQTNQTPKSKHNLDSDTRLFRTLEVTIGAMTTCVEMALARHAKVIFKAIPGNHDPHSYLAVLFAMRERYRFNPRVTVECEPGEFWVYQHGQCLLASHHGDKAKPERLVLFLADEHSAIWGATRHRFLFTGHLHSHKSQDIGGVTHEQLRAVTARDAYASSHAYVGRAQLQGITFHRTKGEIQRVKVAA